MKLNNDAIKQVLNYVIDNQKFDLDNGCMTTIEILTIVNDLSNKDEDKRQEISTAIYRCIQNSFTVIILISCGARQ